jgi:hypothetical protein
MAADSLTIWKIKDDRLSISRAQYFKTAVSCTLTSPKVDIRVFFLKKKKEKEKKTKKSLFLQVQIYLITRN